MRVLVTGSRGWTDEKAIFDRLSVLPAGTTIIHGRAANGADMIADGIALQLGFDLERFRADWETHGKKAGILRNLEMLNTRPDLVLAFWDGKSPGTQHCISAARVKGIPVEVISP